MDEKHRELVEDVFLKSSFRLTENGSVTPIYIIIMEDSLLPVMVHGMEKLNLDQYATIASSIALETNAKAMILICEQWIVKIPEGTPSLHTIVPSEQPDRIECLAVVYMDEAGECSILSGEIFTDPSGTKYTKNSEWMEKASVVSGIMEPWKT